MVVSLSPVGCMDDQQLMLWFRLHVHYYYIIYYPWGVEYGLPTQAVSGYMLQWMTHNTHIYRAVFS